MSCYRDGLQESNVVTRTFVVDEGSPRDVVSDEAQQLIDSMFETDNCDLESVDSYKPKKTLQPVPASRSPTKVCKCKLFLNCNKS